MRCSGTHAHIHIIKSGTLHPAKIITGSTALVPIGGPVLAGLNRRPYFNCRSAMISHMEQLARYCESTWTLRKHARTHTPRPYVYRVRRTSAEVEEAHLQRALAGCLNTGPMPSSSLCAKGGFHHLCECPFAGHWIRPRATGAILCHRAPQGGSQRTDIGHTHAACSLNLPYALFASVFHMQEAENPGSTMLQHGTPHPESRGPVAALENMRPPRTPALPSLHTHAERRAALLCPRASQSVQASTNTRQASGTARRPTQTPMPALPRPLTLPTDALTTHHPHTASPQATKTQDPPPPAFGRPAVP